MASFKVSLAPLNCIEAAPQRLIHRLLPVCHMTSTPIALPRLALLLAIFTPALGEAAEPLRWRFEPGLSNRYRITQQTQIERSGAGGDAAASTTLTIDSSWTVKQVNSDGSALLNQRIDRMRIKSATGDGQQAEIDSQALDNPQGPAAMLTPLLKAITSSPFSVAMTPRGEISDVDVPDDLVEALKNQPGAAQLGDLASAEGFKKLVAQAGFVLPETLEPGMEFTNKTETNAPAIGTQTAEITYRYEGSRELDGKTMEIFKPQIVVKFTGGPATIDVADQSSEGELLFNRTDGRLESSSLRQQLTLKITVAGQQTDQKITQQVDMQWLPADAP
ncbi:MAG: hypothetical protein IT424_00075 [Pirellulales bacterium]|nr:hypothetical protein [Pirellulales bacterium]